MKETLARFVMRIGDELVQLMHGRMRFVWFTVGIETISLYDKVDNVRSWQKAQHNVEMLRSASAYLNVHKSDMAPKLFVTLYQINEAHQVGVKSLGNVVILLFRALARSGGVR